MIRRSLATIGARLNVDDVANRFIEKFYKNGSQVRNGLGARFQILVYHKVSPDPHPFFEPVEPGKFEEQMVHLKRCYNVMPLEELVERNARGETPERAVAITFDDGYKDNYEYAFPILKKHGLPATIFVATGAIGNKIVLWHDCVFDAFRYTTRESAHIPSLGVAELRLDSQESRQRSLQLTLKKAKTLWGESRRVFVEEVEDALQPAAGQTRNYMLEWDEISEMHEAGISFGSHTVTHPVLSRIPYEQLVKELQESKAELSGRLKTPITTFAYPNGKATDYSEEVKGVLRECGYKCAVTTCVGVNHDFADPYELKRDLPWDKEIELFRFRLFLQRHGLS